MIMTITPLVEVASTPKAAVATIAHLLGLVVGAGLTFGVAAAIGAATPRWPFLPQAALVMMGLLLLASLVRVVPQSAWQVPRGWMREHVALGAARYGLVLGTGFATKAPYGAWIAALLLVWLAATASISWIAAFAYAVGRWLPVAIAISVRPRVDPRMVAMEFTGRWRLFRAIDIALLSITIWVLGNGLGAFAG